MHPIPTNLVGLIVVLAIPLSCGGRGTCRNLDLYPVQMGKRLVRHSIKNVSVTAIEECSVQCFMESACVSYNLGPQVNGKRRCELSDSDQQRHPHDLVQEHGYGYRESKNACVSSPCLNFTRCLPGFGAGGFVCVCPAGFRGNLCQEDIDECADASHNCSQHALCENTVGSFTCTCDSRYYGDGVNCTMHSYGSQFNAGKSCKDIKNRTSTTKDAEYWINPNSSANPFKVFCDMTTDRGGWTLIKRTLLSTNRTASLRLKPLAIQDYRGISNYTLNHQVVPSNVLKSLREDMDFDQLRFYCYKKAVGRVFHIKTALNDLGEAVVHSFTLAHLSLGDLAYQPTACGSFEAFSDDTSILSKNCKKWGNTAPDVYTQNRWSAYRYKGAMRIYNFPVGIKYANTVRMLTAVNKVKFSCDDAGVEDKSAPLSSGDVWEVFVR